jgi:hypothetical protein
MPQIDAEEITKVLKDAAYVTVGLGVIAFQKAQVQRVELTKQLQGQATEAKDQFATASTFVEDRVKLLEERLNDLEARIEQVLDQVEGKLPEQAADLVKQARDAAKDARGQLGSLVGRTSKAA